MRPTEEIIEEAEWIEVGKSGCLIPDAEVTEGDHGDEPEE
jgi:hypothetical protein